ncbi:hypothetical protein [Mycoplasmopsis columboralis]|uniref:YobI-like P-loop NTPase domain-containing protein n=1 Tax=Mycoplasmopsis columboralis TaxID=171282 RepID=A0A449B5T6_9BACT|nr:hypothetical protein [Mycoplasmopsis columboralis]VEU75973.1 Uncharacterised protein [Mycoplasmopsis columboralis]
MKKKEKLNHTKGDILNNLWNKVKKESDAKLIDLYGNKLKTLYFKGNSDSHAFITRNTEDAKLAIETYYNLRIDYNVISMWQLGHIKPPKLWYIDLKDDFKSNSSNINESYLRLIKKLSNQIENYKKPNASYNFQKERTIIDFVRSISIYIAFAILFAVLFVISYNFDNIIISAYINPRSPFYNTFIFVGIIYLLIGSFLGSGFFLYKILFRWTKTVKMKLKKFYIKGIEFSREEQIFFSNENDNYLNEIIYYFSIHKNNYIIISNANFNEQKIIIEELEEIKKLINKGVNTKNIKVKIIYLIEEEKFKLSEVKEYISGVFNIDTILYKSENFEYVLKKYFELTNMTVYEKTVKKSSLLFKNKKDLEVVISEFNRQIETKSNQNPNATYIGIIKDYFEVNLNDDSQ